MKAMILAAGRGKRMAPLTDHCPKPLLPLAGKALIVHHLEKLAAAGIKQVVINHAWLGDKLVAALGNGQIWGLDIHYSAEPEGGLETGGGVLQVLPWLGDEPFLLVNGDVWTNADYQALAQPRLNQHLAWLWLVANPQHHLAGDFVLQGDKLAVPSAAHAASYTFSGLSIIDPKLLAGQQPGFFPLAPIFRAAMAQQKITGGVLQADWVDVGTPQRLTALEQQLQSNKRYVDR